MKKTIIALLKPLSFIPAIIMMVVIYSFSSQTGSSSGDLSYRISYEIVETKDILLNTQLSEWELSEQAYSLHYYVRKAAHITEFFLLAVCLSFPLYVYGIRGFRLFLLACIFCICYAGLDEFHQSMVSGRGSSIKDVGIDSIGVLLGCILVQAFCWSVTHRPNERSFM
ncbi:MAG: VanZ family protein [Blautia sp.]|nr:VanZ family protein [Blautia sp.]